MELHVITKFTNHILSYIKAYPNLGLLMSFSISFIESLPVLGTVFPGSVTMTAMGTLVGAGFIPPHTTIFFAALGAIVGDIVGYFLGHFYKDKLRNGYILKNKKKWLDKGELFFKKHGGKSIIIGRFFGPMRSMVPMIAGILNMKLVKFLVAAIPTSFLWAFVYIAPGIFLGSIAKQLPPKQAAEFLILGIVFIAFMWGFFWIIQRTILFIVKQINNFNKYLWKKMQSNKYFGFIYKSILRKDDISDHTQLVLLFGSLLFAFLFICIFYSVRNFGFITNINYNLYYFLQTLRFEKLTKSLLTITFIGDKFVVLIATILISSFLVLRKNFRNAAYIFSIVSLGIITVYLLKKFFYFPRPSELAFINITSSFPSGHTAISFLFFGFATYLLTYLTPRKKRYILYSAFALIISLVSFSRLYLGAHWLSDILASYSLGASLLMMFILIHRKKTSNTLTINNFLIPFLVFSTLSWSVFGTMHFQKFFSGYKHVWKAKNLSSYSWWNMKEGVIHSLPLYRPGRLGYPKHPFNVQWKGKLKKIAAVLKQNGWQNEKNKNVFQLIVSRVENLNIINHLPIFKQLYQNSPPKIFLVKNLGKDIVEISLWKAPVKLTDTNETLFIGTVIFQLQPKSYIESPKFKFVIEDHDAISILKNDLSKSFETKIISFKQEHEKSEYKNNLKWDGSVILISDI